MGAGAAAWRLLIAGLGLSVCELLLVVAFDRRLFLSETELRRYVLAGATVPAALLLVLGGGVWFGVVSVWARRKSAAPLAHVAGALTLPLSAGVLWLSTNGRRVRDAPWRVVAVAVLAVLLAWCAARAVRGLETLLRDGSQFQRVRWGIGFAVAAAGALALDSLVLRRLYPVFHLVLSLGALVAAGTAAALWPSTHALSRPARRGAAVLMAVVLVVAAGALLALRAAPNARFAVTLAAPLTGKVLALLPSTAAPSVAAATAPATPPLDVQLGGQAGVDLRNSDVLLVTVDALRADRLRALGGHGEAPHIDALGNEGVVFERAYTPTPHTSYALSSLFTGKYLRQVLSLPNAPTEHPALPELLRSHGYRTAAFYPPAVFFVDAERFATLADRRFGFEYTKQMFASGAERVRQLERYMEQAEVGRSLFVWVHLFEPHEPYEPPAEFARGSTPVERYDGEVAAADAAVADLVRVFRAARPGAVVIVTSDHGEEFGEHGGLHHGTSLYDEQVRVPLVWSAPGKLKARRVAQAVNLVDVAPTLLSALGIPRDARMRGLDLGELLVHDGDAGAGSLPTTFASIDALRMVTDGAYKLLCDPLAGGCRLFDLARDPFERSDVSEALPEVRARLERSLSEFVGSIARVEAMSMEGGGGWPEALARAALGDLRSAPDVVPLLGSARPEVRAEAARRLGELGHAAALATLAGLRERDPAAEVRAEAALASLLFGDAGASEAVAALLDEAQPEERRRRAALVLAKRGEFSSAAVLLAWADDANASLRERRAAIQALGVLGSADAVPGLGALIDDVNLRVPLVKALGRIGGRAAAQVIADALARERYPESRRAEIAELIALRDRRAAQFLWRWLGTPSSVPQGVELLHSLGALSPPSGRGALIAQAPKQGDWQCDAEGCEPGQGAQVCLPRRAAPRAAARATFRVQSDNDGAELRVAEHVSEVPAGVSETGFDLTRAGGCLAIGAAPGVRLLALAVAPASADLPPPPPEPWHADSAPDAGVPAAP